MTPALFELGQRAFALLISTRVRRGFLLWGGGDPPDSTGVTGRNRTLITRFEAGHLILWTTVTFIS